MPVSSLFQDSSRLAQKPSSETRIAPVKPSIGHAQPSSPKVRHPVPASQRGLFDQLLAVVFTDLQFVAFGIAASSLIQDILQRLVLRAPGGSHRPDGISQARRYPYIRRSLTSEQISCLVEYGLERIHMVKEEGIPTRLEWSKDGKLVRSITIHR